MSKGQFLIFVIWGLTALVEGSPPPPSCANIVCTTPPAGLKCKKTIITNANLLKKIGGLKDCCPAWRCQESDGTASTYFGIIGLDDTDAANAASGGTPVNERIRDSAPTPAPSVDKCADAKITCPTPDGTDTCSSFSATSADMSYFIPQGDFSTCCPVFNCTNPDGLGYHLHYSINGGVQPRTISELKKAMGVRTPGVKCPSISCAPKPEADINGNPFCTASTDDDSSRIKALGPLRECCNVWKCINDDGTYQTHFELQTTTGFIVGETTYHYSAPNESITITQPPVSTTPAAIISSSTTVSPLTGNPIVTTSTFAPQLVTMPTSIGTTPASTTPISTSTSSPMATSTGATTAGTSTPGPASSGGAGPLTPTPPVGLSSVLSGPSANRAGPAGRRMNSQSQGPQQRGPPAPMVIQQRTQAMRIQGPKTITATSSGKSKNINTQFSESNWQNGVTVQDNGMVETGQSVMQIGPIMMQPRSGSGPGPLPVNGSGSAVQGQGGQSSPGAGRPGQNGKGGVGLQRNAGALRITGGKTITSVSNGTSKNINKQFAESDWQNGVTVQDNGMIETGGSATQIRPMQKQPNQQNQNRQPQQQRSQNPGIPMGPPGTYPGQMPGQMGGQMPGQQQPMPGQYGQFGQVPMGPPQGQGYGPPMQQQGMAMYY